MGSINKMQSKGHDIKVVILGDSGVGKSSILLRFVTNDFHPNYESTIGASFMAKMMIHNDKAYKLQIWDTAGQEKYHCLAPLYYKDSTVAIVVYDVTNRESFKVVQNRVKEVQKFGSKDLVLAIVGNKIDLIDDEEVDYN